MDNTIKISKSEYLALYRQAKAYQKLVSRFFNTVLTDSTDEVVEDFRKTNLYTEDFLKDLKSGLKKSSYSKK